MLGGSIFTACSLAHFLESLDEVLHCMRWQQCQQAQECFSKLGKLANADSRDNRAGGYLMPNMQCM